MMCKYCGKKCIKKGKVNKRQRYQCKVCNRYQQSIYILSHISPEKYQWVRELTCEGCGISSISRLLHITKSSVQRIIGRIASVITLPKYSESNQRYEMDELRTYYGTKKNESWIMYAINKTTGRVIDFCVGRRTKENISKVVQSVLQLQPQKIYTGCVPDCTCAYSETSTILFTDYY